MDLETNTKQTLIAKCKEHSIKGYSGKTKPQLIELLNPFYFAAQEQPIPDEEPLPNDLRISSVGDTDAKRGIPFAYPTGLFATLQSEERPSGFSS